jgi:hypothetical protein
LHCKILLFDHDIYLRCSAISTVLIICRVNTLYKTKEIMMLSFLKKFFANRPTVSPCPEAPYKVETPATAPGVVPMSTQYAETDTPKKKPAVKRAAGAKKPAVKAKTARNKKTAQ